MFLPPWCLLLFIDGTPVSTINDVQDVFTHLCSTSQCACTCVFAHDEACNSLTLAGTLQLYFDQWRDIRELCQAAHFSTLHVLQSLHVARKLTQSILLRQDDWPLQVAAEFLQLKQYADQGMFGDPAPIPTGAPVFRWVY